MSITRNVLFLIITVSTILFLLSVTILVLFPSIYERKIEEQTNIVEKSFLYEIWRDLPLPIHQKLYFFNITNSEYYLKYGGILEVNEVGPYVYKSRWVKECIEWHSNGTVSYKEVKTYDFVPEKSIGDEYDKIFTLNGPLIMAADFLKGKSSEARIGADKIFGMMGEKLVIRKTVKELAFAGYKDPIIRFSKFFRPETPFKDNKFSWLVGRNSTDDGLFTVFTGERDHRLLNKIDKWNGNSSLSFWKDEFCNKINGSNAEFGPPLRENQHEYTFFQPIFCRSMTFSYEGMKIHKDIVSKRFQNNVEVFNKYNPDNYCFNIDPDLDSGVLDASPCQFDAPIVLSFPHFYLADPEFLYNIVGLNPNKENHSSYIDVEPLSGITINLSIKLQVNMKMKLIEHLSAFKDVYPGVYPIFWIEMSAELTDELADMMRDQLYKPKIIAHAAIGGMMLISVIVFVVAVWKLTKLKGDYEDLSNYENKSLLSGSGDSFMATNSGAIHEIAKDISLGISRSQASNSGKVSTSRDGSQIFSTQKSEVLIRPDSMSAYVDVKSMKMDKSSENSSSTT